MHLIKFCQLCSTLVSFVQLCSTMFIFVELCLILLNFVHLCLILLVNVVQLCVAVHKFCACLKRLSVIKILERPVHGQRIYWLCTLALSVHADSGQMSSEHLSVFVQLSFRQDLNFSKICSVKILALQAISVRAKSRLRDTITQT